MGDFVFACPTCRVRLEEIDSEQQRCPIEGTIYRRESGIWRLLPPDRAVYFQRFMAEYETVRRAEGWGASDASYYRALPFEDRTGRFRDLWRIRADNFRVLIDRALKPIEVRQRRALKIVDLGAGNGWLSYRLAQRGHCVAAFDVLLNDQDGLGAHQYYVAAFTPVQAEFDRLPLDAAQIDCVVFNGSLHYSVEYETTVREALRVLRSDGRLVILDSPVYRAANSGKQMVREREARFDREYGFRSNSLPSENYLTYGRLNDLGTKLKVQWQLFKPFHGWRWPLRHWKIQIVDQREPAGFPVIAGRRIS
jgi:SAM-dependent methyltransferase